MRKLLRYGALVDARNDSGHTPLHWAASMGHSDAVSMLLGAGADAKAETAASPHPTRGCARQVQDRSGACARRPECAHGGAAGGARDGADVSGRQWAPGTRRPTNPPLRRCSAASGPRDVFGTVLGGLSGTHRRPLRPDPALKHRRGRGQVLAERIRDAAGIRSRAIR